MTGNEAKIKVLLLFGGVSGEHPISCITASSVLHAIDQDKYEPLPVGITKDGQWTYLPADEYQADLGNGELPEITEVGTPARLDVTGGTQELVVVQDGQDVSLGKIDVVFPLLHGPFGEDGTVQGLLEIAALPYVGPGVLASAVGMDKHYMKLAFKAVGLEVGPYVVLDNKKFSRDPEAGYDAAEALGYPLFVKPARAGSSLGITRVTDREGLIAAVDEARNHDLKVVIESAIAGREIECAVLEGHGNDPARASYPGEIVVTGGQDEFYDFEAKYMDRAASELSCPADLSEEAIAEVRRQAVIAFDAVDAEGLSRVDFFYTPEGKFVINEINTMPGFTPISMYPQMWDKTGLPYPQLVDELLTLALERPIGLR
ncbi:D-alanine--D-alanine ligase family protein [Micrococcoides hystricis]|uniref:D-alanine--D-alanine ligase n=1 Tax=Micrococcoides hystricis TaxID=1572761 RepID=A0ABV6PC19_9MICC